MMHSEANSASVCRKADLLFVLAGAQDRKRYALELFRQGVVASVLFSVSRFEIRRFDNLPLPGPLGLLSLAAPIPPPDRHFFVHCEEQTCNATVIKPGRFGTLTEILALRDWLQGHPGARSLIVLSNPGHLMRLRLCCRFLLPPLETQFCAPPVEMSDPHDGDRLGGMFIELAKLAAYLPILLFRRLRQYTDSCRPGVS